MEFFIKHWIESLKRYPNPLVGAARLLAMGVVVVGVTLFSSGCANVSNTQSQPSLKTYLSRIEKAVPNCEFEQFKIPKDVVFSGSLQEAKDYLIYPVLALSETKNIYKLDASGNPDYSVNSDERIVNKYNDVIYVCNTEGTKLSDINSSKQIYGAGRDCHAYDTLSSKDLERLVNICLKAQDIDTKMGFWIVVRSSANQEHLKQTAIKKARDNMSYGYSDYPLLYEGTILIGLDSADFDGITLAGVQSADLLWKKIKATTKIPSIGKLIPGYPTSFNRDYDPKHTQGNYFYREEINATYEQWLQNAECAGSLSISELKYSPGQCGSMKFDVFQADADTGQCLFLGDWVDENGSTKTGIVNFCDVYGQSSFDEGKTYNLKVRVDGLTSYNTKLGYHNNVLAFTAVR